MEGYYKSQEPIQWLRFV